MANTAHKTAEAMEEIEWDAAKIEAAAKVTAAKILAAKHVVIFTGAGISTSAGIPDFRGPEGAWTLAAQNKQRTAKTVSMGSAMATPTHMAMVELYRRGKLQFVISQNVDGLHRKTGIPATHIAELHGNSNIEECDTCGKQVARDFMIHGAQGHYTGRPCVAAGCSGQLRDTIINFRENLPAVELHNGFSHSEAADVHICLGSSLTVSPACDMPMTTKNRGGALIICNLQRTPLDKAADIRVHGRIDDFMIAVMRHLNFSIPPFLLTFRVALWTTTTTAARPTLSLSGVLEDGTPRTLFEKVTVGSEESVYSSGLTPHVFSQPHTSADKIVLNFFGHYDEPPVQLDLPESIIIATGGQQTTTAAAAAHAAGYLLQYDPIGRSFVKVERDDANITPPSYTKGKTPTRVEKTSKTVVNDGTGIDYSNWFAVSPLKHCEHCEQVQFREGVVLDTNAACVECGNVGENMQCLSCFQVHCGRHVNQHMLAHHEETKHPMVVGFADLSFWCYECEAYINNTNRYLELIYRLLHNAKFGFEAESSPEQTTVAAPKSKSVAASPPAVASAVKGEVVGSKRPRAQPTVDHSNWFAVSPLKHCEHCEQVHLREGIVLDPSAACVECGNVGENMQCLSCFQVHCGRHVNQHMLAHHEETKHPMVVGFADLSFWCYDCEAYINNTNRYLDLIYRLLHDAKFNEGTAAAGMIGATTVTTAPTATAADVTAAFQDELQQGPTAVVAPDCLHCRRVTNEALASAITRRSLCQSCGTTEDGECAVCLECQSVFCGREAKAHMLAHHDESRHCIAMSLRDSRCWCYLCDCYVSSTHHPAIRNLSNALKSRQ